MQPDKRLLDHPFYQQWERGEITRGQLADYAAAYQAFMDRVPTYWTRVLEGLGADDDRGRAIVEDERRHAELWAEWSQGLELPDEPAPLSGLFEALEGMTAAELAGAIHAYEVQQPAVAETKRAGLLEHYGVATEALEFFDEHVEGEAEHIAYGARLRETCDDPGSFDRGFDRGAEAVYHSLDAFVAG